MEHQLGHVVTHYPFEYTTGLDMIGHAARVYYKMERNAPVVFAIVDRATKVEYITYNSNTTLPPPAVWVTRRTVSRYWSSTIT